MSQPLEALVAVLNAALEHCPEQTRKCLVAMANPQIEALKAALSC